MERILRRALVAIAVKAAPARKTSRRARDIYREASCALQIAMWIDGGRRAAQERFGIEEEPR